VGSAEAADPVVTVLESKAALELGDKELAQALLMSLDDSISSSDSEDEDMAAAVAASLVGMNTAEADLAQAIKTSLADEKAKGKQPASLEQQMTQAFLFSCWLHAADDAADSGRQRQWRLQRQWCHAGTAEHQLACHCSAVCVTAQCCVSG